MGLPERREIDPKNRSGWRRSGSLSPGQRDHDTTTNWRGELNKAGSVQRLVEAFCTPIPNNCPPKVGRHQPTSHADTRPPTTAVIEYLINQSK